MGIIGAGTVAEDVRRYSVWDGTRKGRKMEMSQTLNTSESSGARNPLLERLGSG